MIPSSYGTTRADGTADDSGDYEYGDSKEYGVNTVYLYFYDDDSGAYTTKAVLSGFTNSGSMTNPTSLTDYDVWTSSAPAKVQNVTAGTAYRVYALVNEGIDGTPTEGELKDATLGTISEKITAIPSSGIPMSSRTDDGTLSQNITFTSDNAKSTEPASISFVVERSYAKLSLSAVTPTETNTVNAYAIKSKVAPYGKVATVTLGGYKLVNLPVNNYAFRHVGMLDATPEATSIGFGPITKTYPTELTAAGDVLSESTAPYIIIPDYANYVATPGDTSEFLYSDADFTKMPISTDSTIAYSYENAMYKTYQKEGYVTGITFEAYVRPDTLWYMDNGLTSKTGDNVHDALSNSSYADSLYCLGDKFFGSLEAIQAMYPSAYSDLSHDNAAEKGITVLEIKKVNGLYYGVCYYKAWIKHFDNGLPVIMGASEYSIVRNNVYKMSVTVIKNIGDKDPNPNPDEPVEKENYYLDVDLSIKPWIVRTNDFEF